MSQFKSLREQQYETTMAAKNLWVGWNSKRHGCNNCWHGVCMCGGVGPARNPIIPRGKDDHMYQFQEPKDPDKESPPPQPKEAPPENTPENPRIWDPDKENQDK